MPNTLYRFVKASERLPQDKKNESGGWIKSANGFYFCNCEDDVVDVCQFKTSWGEFRHIYTDPYREEKANVISWLEEVKEADQQGLSSPPTAIREEGHTPASIEEILDKYWKDESLTRRDSALLAMQEYSQAKEKEIDFWKKEYSVYKDGCHERDEKLTAKEAELKKIEDALLEITEASCKKHEETISELRYWKELAEAGGKVIEAVEKWSGGARISEVDEMRSDILGAKETWQALKNQKSNRDMETNGASQEKLNSSTSDGKINSDKE